MGNAGQRVPSAREHKGEERRDMSEVEIDPFVLYLLAMVCGFAFLPPMMCKLRQALCNNAVQDYNPNATEDD